MFVEFLSPCESNFLNQFLFYFKRILSKKKKKSTSSTSAQPKTDKNKSFEDDLPLSALACKSTTNSKTSSIKSNGDSKEINDDIPLAKIVVNTKPITGNSATSESEATTDQDKKTKIESLAPPKLPTPLPPSLSEEGKKLVDQLKACAESCIKGKFFTPEVNKILLE